VRHHKKGKSLGTDHAVRTGVGEWREVGTQHSKSSASPRARGWVGCNGCEISVPLELILADGGRDRRTELGLI